MPCAPLHKWTGERESAHLHFSWRSVRRWREGERGVIDPADPDWSRGGGADEKGEKLLWCLGG